MVRRGLERHVLDLPVQAVEVLHPRPVRRHLPGPEDFVHRLTGRAFSAARRRGKYLWLATDSGDAVLAHLGMSGQMLVADAGSPDPLHLRVRFDLGDRHLQFVDQRMFGGLSYSDDGADLPQEVRHIALDVFDEAFDPAAVVRRIRGSASGIKRLLLNQGVVSGIGNIYADEALWRARINAERPGKALSAALVRDLLGHARDVMSAALDQGGTSFDALYVNVNGESGYFDRSLDAYGQEGRPCARCGTPIVRTAFMNRSSFFCPLCQPAPRRRRP